MGIEVSTKVELKPLFLTIERVYFNQIYEGIKKIEYREFKPFYTSRLMKSGKYRNFKTILLQEGYHKNARRMLLEIDKIILFNDIYEIHLGKIIEKNF